MNIVPMIDSLNRVRYLGGHGAGRLMWRLNCIPLLRIEAMVEGPTMSGKTSLHKVAHVRI